MTPRRLIASALLVTFSTSGCASMVPPAGFEPDLLAMDEPTPPTTSPTTETEATASPATQAAPAVAPDEESPVVAATAPIVPQPTVDGVAEPQSTLEHEEPSRDDLEQQQRNRNIVFWTGIAAVAIGGAGTLAFGLTGRITQHQLNREFDDGLTRDREDQLRSRGEWANGLAIGSGMLALIGLGMSTIAYALDYNRCGDLSRRRWRRSCAGPKY